MSLVSIVIPVRDGERYLAEAIDSALAQEDAHVEVIVVDDGSSDSSAEIAASYGPRVRLVRTPPRGIGAARNTGVDLAVGEFVTFNDADDVLTPRSLACRLEPFARAPATGIVWGLAQSFRSPDLSPEEAGRLECPERPQRARVTQGMLVRRDTLRRIGRFNTELVAGEFIEWAARAHDAGVVQCEVDEVVFLRRLHLANNGRKRRDAVGDYARALKAVLDRRRAEASP
jgi:glycosyltransferase involved in cell wall biosynthesis